MSPFLLLDFLPSLYDVRERASDDALWLDFISVSTSYLLFLPHAAGEGRENNHPGGPFPSFAEAEHVPDVVGTFLALKGPDQGSMHAEN